MRWPAGVIASVCLGAGFNRDTAVTAVAVALAATGGDDSAVFGPTILDGPAFAGAWAVPLELVHQYPESSPFSLREQARVVRALTGPAGDNWSWSVIWRQGSHEPFLASARAAVDNPAPGAAPPPPGAATRLLGGSAAIDQAEAHTAAAVAGVADWRPRNPITGV